MSGPNVPTTARRHHVSVAVESLCSAVRTLERDGASGNETIDVSHSYALALNGLAHLYGQLNGVDAVHVQITGSKNGADIMRDGKFIRLKE